MLRRVIRVAGRSWRRHHQHYQEEEHHFIRRGKEALSSRRTFDRSFHETLIQLLDYEKRILVCGDGNLSYSASIAQRLNEQGRHLTATVLESQQEHERVYENSVDNVNLITSLGHDVQFQVDATCLERYHDDEKFDLIQFNFPHWKGKTNARRNRILLHDFFQASARILTPNGHVVTALMNHQGGAFASNIQEWKQSWLPAQYAANHGLLLTQVEPFDPVYQLSSYRGEDRTFDIRGEPQLYIFANTVGSSNNPRAHEDVQLFCHFNIYLHCKDGETADFFSGNETCNRLQHHVSGQLPDGWRGHVSFVKLMTSNDGGWIVVYKICFFGEFMPILQSKADDYRTLVQDSMVANKMPLLLRQNWAISKPYPSSLLPSILQADRER